MTPVAAEGLKPSNTMGVARRQRTGQVFLTNQIVSLCGLDPSEAQVLDLLPTTTAADAKASGGAEGSSNVTLTDAIVRGRGLLPTPAAGAFTDGETVEQWDARRERIKAKGINGNGMGEPLAIAAKRLAAKCPTCGCPDEHHDADGFCGGLCGGNGHDCYGRLLPTPSANIGSNGGSQHPDKRRAGNHQPSIQDVAEHVLLPTPRATRGGSGTETMYSLGAERTDDNRPQGEVLLLQTPAVADGEGSRKARGGERSNEKLLPGQAIEMATDWGLYAPAIHRWERVLGRAAPAPTEPNSKGGHRLSPRFCEFLMGVPEGWITDTPISRNEQLKAAGNGVVPAQSAAALKDMLLSFQRQESAA